MKLKTKLIVLAGVVFLMMPVSSFALVDVNAYLGYTVGGSWNNLDVKMKGKDLRYGFSAHLNGDFLVFLKLGIGGYYQGSSVTYKATDNFTVDKQALGLDFYAMLNLPMMPLSPYVKYNTAAWNKLKFHNHSRRDHFKRHGFGLGAAFTLLPVPGVMNLQVFGEYVYAFGKEAKEDSQEHQINIGIRADFL